MKMKCLLLIMLVFATYENENLDSDTKSEEKNVAEQPTVVKIEEDEYVKENVTKYAFSKINTQNENTEIIGVARFVRFRRKPPITLACTTARDTQDGAHVDTAKLKKEPLPTGRTMMKKLRLMRVTLWQEI